MAAPSPPTRQLVLATLVFAVAILSTGGAKADDPYQVLQAYGLPRGVLPQGAQGYHLDPESGHFDVSLASQCDVAAGSHTVRYEASVSGTIANGSLSDLNGVAVEFIFWIPISRVKKEDGNLIFTVGPARETFPVSTFQNSPACM
ncbi:hypothetical protein ACQ4PT_017687 [Festuca glaucescens]